MANNDIIRHDDIAEVNVTKPFIEDLNAASNAVDVLEKHVISLAKTGKSVLGNLKFTDVESIKKLTDETYKANKAMEDAKNIAIAKKQIEDQLNAALQEQAAEIKKLTEQIDALNVKKEKTTKLSVDERVEAERRTKVAKEEARINNENAGAYDRASAKLLKMNRIYKDLVISGKENNTSTIAFKKSLDELQASVLKADHSVGDFRRSVGNYASATNGLRISIGQIARELPSLSNGFAIFASAIGNNIAPASDAIAQFRAQQKAMAAEGKATQSLFSALGGAIFNFQTGLLIAVTLLTVFGKEIGEFGKSLFSAKKGVIDLDDASNTLAENRKKNLQGIQDEVVKLEQLKTILNDGNESLQIKKQAYVDLQKLVPSLTNLTYEQAIAQGVLNSSIQRELELLDLRAEFEALNSNIVEQKKAAIAQKKLDDQKRLIILLDEQKRLEFDIEQINAGKGGYDVQAITDRYAANAKEIEQLKKSDVEKAEIVHKRILQLEAEIKAQDDLARAAIENAKKRKKAEEDALKDSIKSAHETFLALENEMVLSDEADERLKERERKAAEADKKYQEDQDKQNIKQAEEYRKKQFEEAEEARKKEKERLEQFEKDKQAIANKSVQILKSLLDKQTAQRLSAIDRELNASKKREDELRNNARISAQDKERNLAFEERKQAELAAKREKQIKRQLQQEKALAIIKMISNGNASGAKNISDLVNSIPSFLEGTEDTGIANNPLDKDGGRLVVVHNKERIFTKEQNRKVGDLSNNDAANILHQFNLGQLINPTQFDKMPMVNIISDNAQVAKLNELSQKLDTLNNTIKSQPIKDQAFDEVNKMIVTTIKTSGRTEITRHKPRFNG